MAEADYRRYPDLDDLLPAAWRGVLEAGPGAEGSHPFFFDLETTGLFKYAAPPAIVDIAIVDGITGAARQWLVQPGRFAPIKRDAE